MRADEEFVADAVARCFQGSWKPGGDPPDFILQVNGETVAVEVSTLAEQVSAGRNRAKPRRSVDSAAVAMCERLDSSLRYQIPNVMTVIVILQAPLREFSRCEARIRNAILRGVGEIRDREEKIDVLGNSVLLHYSLVPRVSGKKVVGIVSNGLASADIFESTRVALDIRLVEKSNTCAALSVRPLWLALLNDYWLASEGTVAEAMKKSAVRHPFDKVLLVRGDGKVSCIHGDATDAPLV